jgi:uncharacterized protein YqjF (DUF2071 family)
MPATPTPEQRAATRVRPARSPVMYQSWNHLLFLHWQWDPAAIQATLPEGLFVDTYANQAYLGVVPFWMDAVRPRFCPPIPGISSFLELNLRTYVHTDDGTPGVWFYSLDCNNPLAVHLARTFFSLPYVHARQTGIRPQSFCHLISDKPAASLGLAEFKSWRFPKTTSADTSNDDVGHNHFAYAGTTPPAPAQPGTLEYFLAERYLLFSQSRRTGQLYSGRVWHRPYALAPAHVSRAEIALFTDNGFPSPDRPADHAMVSPGVAVSIYGIQRVSP